MSSKPVEKAPRKRRGLLGMSYVLLVNMVLMSVLAWFVLLVWFGIYRIHHSSE